MIWVNPIPLTKTLAPWFQLGGTAWAVTGNMDCSKRAMRLGFDTAELDDQTPPVLVHHRQCLMMTRHPMKTKKPRRKVCAESTLLLLRVMPSLLRSHQLRMVPPAVVITVEDAIRDAFHWDMLSKDEMIEAADAANVSRPSAYGHNYGGLTEGQQTKVRRLVRG